MSNFSVYVNLARLKFFFRPDVKISEDASSDKSGTDPEDSSDNFSQADITDYQNYEQVQLEVRTILFFPFYYF